MGENAKLAVGFVVAIVGLVLVVCIINLIALPARTITGIANRVANPDKIIWDYEYFQNTYNDILATKNKIEQAWKSKSNLNLSEETRNAFEINYSGSVNYLFQIIGEYNAKSKLITRTLFKDKSLPHTIRAEVNEDTVKIIEVEE